MYTHTHTHTHTCMPVYPTLHFSVSAVSLITTYLFRKLPKRSPSSRIPTCSPYLSLG